MQNKNFNTLFQWILVIFVFASCNKDKTKVSDNFYQDGTTALIHFKDTKPTPEKGDVGTEVTFDVEGLSALNNDFTFYLGQVEAEIQKVTDSTVTIKVPEHASSGGARILADGQTFLGPLFQVTGKVRVDPTWNAGVGADDAIRQILQKPNGDILLVGSFTDYNKQSASTPVSRLAMISESGEYISGLDMGKGANGRINSIDRNPVSGKLIVGGAFSAYNIRSNINNITLLNSNGSLDSMIVDLVNLDPERTPNAGKDTVPTFNGGISGGTNASVISVFYDQPTNEVYTVGNYNEYTRIYYPRSTKGGPVIDRTEISQITKMRMDGSMDSSFNFNLSAGHSPVGANGFINDAIRLPNGKIIIVGSFTTFNEKKVNHIACINDADGSLDETFITGSGADGDINRITYNKVTDRILLTGVFKKFNDNLVNGVVMLKSDGTMAHDFQFGETEEGKANYAGQLNDGKVLVSGRFTGYEGIARPGFMILNSDGSLAEGYNNTGAFNGKINQMLEGKTAFNTPAVILVGDFNMFDNQEVGNIVKLELLP